MSNRPLGKHKKPPKRLSNYKKAVKLEEGLQFARLKAEDRWKKSSKGFMRSLQDHVGKAIDRIDPIEAAATFGLTYIIHDLILKTEELKKTLDDITAVPITIDSEKYRIGLHGYYPEEEAKLGGLVGQSLGWVSVFPMDWLISFSLAYCIIKYGGQLIGLLDKGLVPVLKLLMGV